MDQLFPQYVWQVVPKYSLELISSVLVVLSCFGCLWITLKHSGADPGFLEGGFKSIKRGFVFNILSDFS